MSCIFIIFPSGGVDLTFVLILVVQVTVINHIEKPQDGSGQQNQILDVRSCSESM